MWCYISSGQIRLTHGGVTAGASFSYATRTAYHVWLELTKGTGANGTMRLYVAQSATKPAIPTASLTTGNGQAADRIYFGAPRPIRPSFCSTRFAWPTVPLGATRDHNHNEKKDSVRINLAVTRRLLLPSYSQ